VEVISTDTCQEWLIKERRYEMSALHIKFQILTGGGSGGDIHRHVPGVV
jgi:hypothetical protein